MRITNRHEPIYSRWREAAINSYGLCSSNFRISETDARRIRERCFFFHAAFDFAQMDR